MVLLIACANVANMLLGRAVARQRETAVRLALGVSRGRLVTQFVSESLLLATAGAAGGLVVAWVARRVVADLLLPGSAPHASLIDARTLTATVGITLAAGLLTGIAPAVLAGREGLASGLRGGARGGTRTSRVRTVLVIAQAALSVVLLIGAALFVRSFSAAQHLWLGYDVDRVLIVNRVLRGTPLDAAARTALRRRLLEAAQQLPGVEYASWRASTPLALNGVGRFFVPGIESVERLGVFTFQETTPDYFKVMGTRILRGRAFTADDRPGTPRVVVVSESMARVLWGGREALGQCLHFGRQDAPCTSVIGIAEDMMQSNLTDPRYQYYLSTEQTGGDGTGMLLRLRGDPAAEAETIRRALQPLMPGVAYITVQPLRMHADRARASWRLGATLFLALAVLAVVVAAVGMYGVIAYTLGQRRHELGVRVALGAQRVDVLWIAIGPGLQFALAGAALGVVAALGAARWIEPLLFRQAAVDPMLYALVAGFMILVALAAGLVPAARAARADPMSALRTD